MHPTFHIPSLFGIKWCSNLVDTLHEHWHEETLRFTRPGSLAIDVRRTHYRRLQPLRRGFQDKLIYVSMRSAIWQRSDGCDIAYVAPDFRILTAMICKVVPVGDNSSAAEVD
jgi:hypothetical protein